MARLTPCRLVVLCALSLVGGAAGATAPVTSGGPGDASRSWAAAEIATVVNAGLMGPDVASFRPDDDLLQGELHDALVIAGASPTPPRDPSHPVTMRELDAKLVGALRLGAAARRVRVSLDDAGLAPTAFAGTETVARLLGLRRNHPQVQEWLERAPHVIASRAEAAYSLTRMLELSPQRVAWLTERVDAFEVPALSDWQRSVLARGLRFVGFPYVFAGTSERRQKLWTAAGKLVDAPAGFDCSGFLWRVYKTEPFPAAPRLATVLRGRTTYAMSGEVGPILRIPFDALEPGDVLFFGTRGPSSKPSEVGHSGLFVGNGWFAHASANGVTLQPLEGWYRTRFAWARRPLAEAGLVATGTALDA